MVQQYAALVMTKVFQKVKTALQQGRPNQNRTHGIMQRLSQVDFFVQRSMHSTHISQVHCLVLLLPTTIVISTRNANTNFTTFNTDYP